MELLCTNERKHFHDNCFKINDRTFSKEVFIAKISSHRMRLNIFIFIDMDFDKKVLFKCFQQHINLVLCGFEKKSSIVKDLNTDLFPAALALVTTFKLETQGKCDFNVMQTKSF